MKSVWEYISARSKYVLSKKQVMSFVMLLLGIYHVCMLVLFAFAVVYPMVVIDVCSIVLYGFCYVQARKSKNLLLVFNLSYAQILVHSVVGVLLIGEESGYGLFLIALLPLGYYASYNFDSKKQTVNPAFYVIFSALAFFFVKTHGMFMKDSYIHLSKYGTKLLYITNYIVVLIILVMFFSTLLNQIRLLENQQLHQNKKLEKLSKTDALTGLANRRSLQERCEHSETLKSGYAVILADIDDFKKINDTYGHNAGDQTLKEVSEVFKKAVRGEDTVCRWGGEEILVFLPGCPLHNAKYRAGEILENIRKLDITTPDKTCFHVTMTFGVAVSEDGDNFTDVVSKADEKLYTGKQNGKNKVV